MVGNLLLQRFHCSQLLPCQQPAPTSSPPAAPLAFACSSRASSTTKLGHLGLLVKPSSHCGMMFWGDSGCRSAWWAAFSLGAGALKGETTQQPILLPSPGWGGASFAISCSSFEIKNASGAGNRDNLWHSQPVLGYGHPAVALLLFLSPFRRHFHLCQQDGTGNEIVPVAVRTSASAARGTVWLAAVRGPMRDASSSSTQLAAAFEQHEGSSALRCSSHLRSCQFTANTTQGSWLW